jgi:hypothetical protein
VERSTDRLQPKVPRVRVHGLPQHLAIGNPNDDDLAEVAASFLTAADTYPAEAPSLSSSWRTRSPG